MGKAYATVIRQKDSARLRYTLATIGAAVLLWLVTIAPTHAATPGSPLLDKRQVDSSDISSFTKWTTVMPRYEMQQSAADKKCYGKNCLNRKWEALLWDLRDKPLELQMNAINRFFNDIAYVSDLENYAIADYWQTPYELMEHGGDCEDYAVAKYISLKRLGVPESSMRILIVKDANLNDTIHAVLEVTVDGTSEILDNQAANVLATADVYHYKPVFAINESKWWAYK